MIRTAIGDFVQVTVYAECARGALDVMLSVYFTTLTRWNPSTEPYPSHLAHCPICFSIFNNRLNTRLALLQRGFWELIIAGAFIAPMYSELLGQKAEPLKPFAGCTWRVAAKSFILAHRYTLKGEDVPSYELLKLINDILNCVDKVQYILDDMAAFENGLKGNFIFFTIGLPNLHKPFVTGTLRGLNEALDKHILYVKKGQIEYATHPSKYQPGKRLYERVEYALLIDENPVITGPEVRLYARGVSEEVLNARVVNMEFRRGDLQVVIEKLLGKRKFELRTFDLNKVVKYPLAMRFYSLLLDGLASIIESRIVSGEAMYIESLEGPLIVWNSESDTKLVTSPSLYVAYGGRHLQNSLLYNVLAQLEPMETNKLVNLIHAALLGFIPSVTGEIVVSGRGTRIVKKLGPPAPKGG